MTKQELTSLQQTINQLTLRIGNIWDIDKPTSLAAYRSNWQSLAEDFVSLDTLGDNENKSTYLQQAQEVVDDLTEEDFKSRKDEVWAVSEKAGKLLMHIIVPLREKIKQKILNQEFTNES